MIVIAKYTSFLGALAIVAAIVFMAFTSPTESRRPGAHAVASLNEHPMTVLTQTVGQREPTP